MKKSFFEGVGLGEKPKKIFFCLFPFLVGGVGVKKK